MIQTTLPRAETQPENKPITKYYGPYVLIGTMMIVGAGALFVSGATLRRRMPRERSDATFGVIEVRDPNLRRQNVTARPDYLLAQQAAAPASDSPESSPTELPEAFTSDRVAAIADRIGRRRRGNGAQRPTSRPRGGMLDEAPAEVVAINALKPQLLEFALNLDGKVQNILDCVQIQMPSWSKDTPVVDADNLEGSKMRRGFPSLGPVKCFLRKEDSFVLRVNNMGSSNIDTLANTKREFEDILKVCDEWIRKYKDFKRFDEWRRKGNQMSDSDEEKMKECHPAEAARMISRYVQTQNL